MNRMLRSLALTALSIAIALMDGCQSSGSGIGSAQLVDITPAVVEGTWALTDSRNDTFNVILREDGSATSTWSRGTDGAMGEQGGWSLRNGEVTVRWTDGWVDTIRLGRFGYENFSYGPSDRDANVPSSFGQAVKILDDGNRWVGVWSTTSVDKASQEAELFICLASDGAAVKSIDAINTGCWQLQQSGAAIYWSDGWFTFLTHRDDGVQGQSWASGTDRTKDPTGTHLWTEVTE